MCPGIARCRSRSLQMLRVMRLTSLFLTVFCIHLSARTVSQEISFTGTNVPLEKLFNVVRQQTGHVFFFKKNILKNARPVTISVKNQSLTVFLETIFDGQPLEYTVENGNVFVRNKAAALDSKSSSRPAVYRNITKKNYCWIYHK